MVQTRRSAALLGNAHEKTKSATSIPLPPRSGNITKRPTNSRQQSQLPSLPTSSLTTAPTTSTSKDAKHCRRVSISRRKSGIHEKSPRGNAPQNDVALLEPNRKRPFELGKGEDNPLRIQPAKAASGENTHTLSKVNNQADPSNKENRQHFLRGINLKNFQDILSIPSPPTPLFGVRPLVPKRDSNRRSSLCHVPSPFEDGQLDGQKKTIPEMKNSQHLFLDGFNDHEEIVAKRSKKRSKRRQTLLVQPTPKISLATRSPQPQKDQKTDLILGGSNEDEDEEDNRHSSLKPSKKRRQSLLLPSDRSELFGIAAQELSEDLSKDMMKEKCSVVESQPPIIQRQAPKLTDLQKLVRGYCGFGTDSMEQKKEFAIRIKQETGYSLSQGEWAEEAASADPEVIRNKRRNLLVEIGPSVQQMEEKKVEQAKEAEMLTGCSVEKTRSGRYKYRDAATGQRVSTEEYKKRYADMIAKKKHEKAQSFEELVPTQEVGVISTRTAGNNDDMDCDDTDVLIEESTPQSHDTATYSCHVKGRPLALDLHAQEEIKIGAGQEVAKYADNHIITDYGSNHDQGMTLAQELSNGNPLTDQHYTRASVREAVLELPEEAFLDQDTSTCIDSELNQGMTLDPDSSIGAFVTGHEPCTVHGENNAEAGRKEFLFEDSSSCFDSGLNQGISQEGDSSMNSRVRAQEIEEPGCEEESTAPESILPVPSREDESDDPEIAAAESRLWRAIDTALEKYSREVMAIQERKRHRR